MRTQHKDSAGTVVAGISPGSAGSKNRRWLVTLGALIVVVLLVGATALVFAQLATRQKNSTASLPPTGQWKQILAGYTSFSLIAAHSNPAILYACATKVNVVSNQQAAPVYTLLRSTDFGDHWQDLSARAALGFTCDMAVNPANPDDLYIVSTSSSARFPALLKHSIDGGQSWQSIQPSLALPNAQTVRWQVQHLSYVGNRLFAIQIVTGAYPASASAIPSPLRSFSAHLVTSADGGRTWAFLDTRSQTFPLSVRSYAVDPTSANTIYELLGPLALPVVDPVPAVQQPAAAPGPVYGLQDQLYKTTNGGASWSLLLQNLPYGTQIQLAGGKPQTIYVGGFSGPVPLAAGPSSPSGRRSPPYAFGFHMQVSVDGGASWQNVMVPSQHFVSWFVGADGLLYIAPFSAASSPGVPGGTPAAATEVPVRPVIPPIPTGGPKYGGPPMKSGTPVQTSSVAVAVNPASSMVPVSAIQRYDPTTQQWSDITTPPSVGALLTLTSTSSTGGAVLWFLGQAGSQYAVYRYIV